MKRFHVMRNNDISGVSGLGYVAEGIKFADGSVVVRWRVAGKPCSMEIHDNVASFIEIHGHGGATKIEWVDNYDEVDVKTAD